MKVRWIRGGLEIPGVGMTEEGKLSKSLPKAMAEDFIKRGIAESDQPKAKLKAKEGKGGKD